MISRRAFLMAGAVLGGVATAAALGYGRLTDNDLRLARDGRRLGALLVPADHAAWLIKTGALAHLAGSPGRPHDPEGQFTVPFRLNGLSLRLPGGEPTLRRLEHAGAWWPADARSMVAAALLATGHSPNTTDRAALQRGERWLQSARPRVDVAPSGAIAIEWLSVDSPVYNAPVEGQIVSEWDWVILAHAPTPHLAEDFIRRQTSTWRQPSPGALVLADVPPTTSFEMCRIFERVAIGRPI